LSRPLILVAILAAVIVVSWIANKLISRRHAITQIDAADLAGATGDPTVVVFTSPYCHGCRQWLTELATRGIENHAIDIGDNPAAAAKYKINSTPRVAVTRTSDGAVLREFDHYTPRAHDLDSIERLVAKN
jgi:thiol-disulfide isomerase/thioredoxin